MYKNNNDSNNNKTVVTSYAKRLFNIKKKIFPKIGDDRIHRLLIDEESLKYITFASAAQQITNIIMNNLSDLPCPDDKINIDRWNLMPLVERMKKLVITEMTAGVGGNVLNFAKYFKYVNAIEIDKIRYRYLTQNVLTYEFENVNCYNDDSVNLLIKNDDIVQDIIFFDPPWGGKNYKKYATLRLTFGDFTIEDICKKLFQRNRNSMIIIKLPNNYDFDYLQNECQEYSITKHCLDRMTIIVLKKIYMNAIDNDILEE